MQAAAAFLNLSFSSSLLLPPPFKTLKPSDPFFNCNPKTLTPIFRPVLKHNNSRRNAIQAASSSKAKSSKNNRRRPSRRSAIKKSFSQEQLIFNAPISNDPNVAIIGGGMSGLLCALGLEKRGVRSTVFDSGMHGLGGRMGTRIIDPQPLIFDHAAQFFTVSDSRFGKLVDGWIERGLVREWCGPIGELETGGYFKPMASSSPRFIGVSGMRPLADSILSQTGMVNVVRPCWISALDPFNGMWHLSENGKPRGQFDAIVIAHNGKCANRLLASSGLPLIARQMKRLELSSIWALLAAFEDPLPIPSSTSGTPFEGAFVKGVDSVSWMANNTKKLFPSQSKGPQCWTFFSTAAYAERNKVPQIADYLQSGGAQPDEFALGLHNEFQLIDGHDIGQFPGLEYKEQVAEVQTCIM